MADFRLPYGFELVKRPLGSGDFLHCPDKPINGRYPITIRPGDPLVLIDGQVERYAKQPTDDQLVTFPNASETKIIGIFHRCKYDARDAVVDIPCIEKKIWPAWVDGECERTCSNGEPAKVYCTPISEGYQFSVQASGSLPDQVDGMYAGICERKSVPGSMQSAVQLDIRSLSPSKGNLPLKVMEIRADQVLIVKFV